MRTKVIVLCIALLSGSGLLFAQTGLSSKADILEIKKRTLIIVIEEPSDKLLKELNGEELESYKKDIEDYNDGIKEAVTLFWKFNDKIEYKTRDEMNKLVSAKSTDYAYIEYNKFIVNTDNAGAYKATLGFKKSKNRPHTLMVNSYINTELNIRLSENKPFSFPVLGIRLPDPFPDKADLALALRTMQLQFKYKLEGKTDKQIQDLYKDNARALPNLTLLVGELDTNTSLEDIKKDYPYPVEVVSKSKIDSIILTANPKYAVVVVTPYKQQTFKFQAISMVDASGLAYFAPMQTTNVEIGEVRYGTAGAIADDLSRMDEERKWAKDKIRGYHFRIFAQYVE